MNINPEQQASRKTALEFARKDFIDLGQDMAEDQVLARAEKYRAFLDGETPAA